MERRREGEKRETLDAKVVGHRCNERNLSQMTDREKCANCTFC